MTTTTKNPKSKSIPFPSNGTKGGRKTPKVAKVAKPKVDPIQQAQEDAEAGLTKLTEEQRSTLRTQEDKIEDAQQAFFHVVEALTVIEDGKLYPDQSFTAYCFRRWSMDSATVTRYRKARHILAVLVKAEVTPLPNNEGQTRVLGRIVAKKKDGSFDTSRVVDVWKKALAIAKDGNLSMSGEVIRRAIGGTTKPDKRKSVNVHHAPVEIVVSGTTKEDAKSLSDALSMKFDTKDGKYYFAKTQKSGFELLLNKIADWFSEKGSRSIDIHLEK